MSDQLLMDNYLLLLKSSVEVYVHGTLESANHKVRKILKCGLDETMMEQGNTYDEMTKYGWYTTTNVKSSQIAQVFKKLN
jgi:spore coat protein CotF